MNEQMIQQYFENLQKFSNNEWTSQQWYDYCTMVLGQLMEEHKDVFIRLKNRGWLFNTFSLFSDLLWKLN
jgi:hypothetical protein